jgi:hypothetical protein
MSSNGKEEQEKTSDNSPNLALHKKKIKVFKAAIRDERKANAAI